jgi:hypothetical protein
MEKRQKEHCFAMPVFHGREEEREDKALIKRPNMMRRPA